MDQGNGNVEGESSYIQNEERLLLFGLVDVRPEWNEISSSQNYLVSNSVLEKNSDINPPVCDLRVDGECERYRASTHSKEDAIMLFHSLIILYFCSAWRERFVIPVVIV